MDAPYEELDDSELSKLRDWLGKKRDAMASERALPQVHFQAQCVGSAWVAKNRGVGSDVARTFAKDAAAATWAKESLGNEMASFSLKCFTESVASALAILWADRAEYWYSLHFEGSLAPTGPTEQQQLLAPAGDSVTELLEGKLGSHPGWKRLRAVLCLSPR